VEILSLENLALYSNSHSQIEGGIEVFYLFRIRRECANETVDKWINWLTWCQTVTA